MSNMGNNIFFNFKSIFPFFFLHFGEINFVSLCVKSPTNFPSPPFSLIFQTVKTPV